MNSSQFMDKQIMDLSRSKNKDFLELLNPQEEQHDNGGGSGNNDLNEEILASYDFQPIRPVVSSQSLNTEGSNGAGTRVRNTNTSFRNYGNLEPNESAKFYQEKDPNACDTVILSEIDQTMKKYADNLLHALEGVSARLSQMESRTRNLENSVDDLKLCIQNNHGSTDGKLTQLENIIRELQTGALVLREGQEIAAAQGHLAKLHASKGDMQLERQNTPHSNFVQQAAFDLQPLPPPVAPLQPPQLLHAPSPPDAPPPQPQHNAPPAQISTQLPQNQMPSIPQREPYFQAPGQLLEATRQQFQFPPVQELQPPAPAPPQHYQSAPQLPPYYQSSQLPQQHPPTGPVNPSPPQHQPPISHHPEETPYIPPQSYPPSIRHSLPMTQPPSGGHSSQQLYGAPAHMYEPPVSKPSSGISPGYGPSSNFSESISYSGSPTHYRSSTMKQSQLSSPSAPSGGGNYPRLPTAQVLPHALPTASSVSGGSSSSGTGNRVPIDDVVDKVATMGFSRDQVRATVRKLTENGQSVDLNVVLDKLMNDGELKSQTGWYGQ